MSFQNKRFLNQFRFPNFDFRILNFEVRFFSLLQGFSMFFDGFLIFQFTFNFPPMDIRSA